MNQSELGARDLKWTVVASGPGFDPVRIAYRLRERIGSLVAGEQYLVDGTLVEIGWIDRPPDLSQTAARIVGKAIDQMIHKGELVKPPQPEPTVKESLTVAVEPEPVITESLTTEPNSPEIPDCSIEIGELERCEANEKITIGYTVPNAYDSDAEPITEPIQRKRVLYIAGPMRGIAWFNYPLFDRVAKELRDAGNEVISPADEDRKHDGFDPYANPAHAHPDACTFPKTMDFSKTVRRCLEAVLRCDEIVLLPGWENSNGAVAELTLAMWLGKRVRDVRIDDQDRITYLGQWMGLTGLAMQLSDYHIPEVEVPYPTGLAEQDDEDDDEDILAEASRITRGSRQAQYGPPDQDFRRTAGMWSALFGAKLKDGVTFEPRDVALAMILLKTSRETHQRKRDNWVDIAGYASCGSRCN
jgi:hypothetical protein